MVTTNSVAAQHIPKAQFARVALASLANGYAPIPVGKLNPDKGSFKIPWIKRHHGFDHVEASSDEIRAWPDMVAERIERARNRETGVLSLGLVLPTSVIGIDVDMYNGKLGGELLEQWRNDLGELPPTFTTTARSDGSAIRLYRVPIGWIGQEIHGSGIELIQNHHRYIVAPPSWHHTGKRYRLFSPAGLLLPSQILPIPTQLPELPQTYLDALERDPKAVGGGSYSDTSILAMASRFEDFSQAHTAERTPKYRGTVLGAFAKCLREQPDSTRNQTRDTLCWLARESRVDAYSFAPAVAEVKRLAQDHYRARGKPFDTGDFARCADFAIFVAHSEDIDELRDRVYKREWKNKPTMPDAARDSPNDSSWADDEDESVVQCLADIDPTVVKWLWKGWIPRGKVSLFEGESDVGKSTLTIDWAATVTTGRPWPLTTIGNRTLKSQSDPAGVVFVGVEDGNADTVVPRLIAAGADRSRVFTMKQPRGDDGRPVPFTVPKDIDHLRKAIQQAKAGLCIIDPITACLPENLDHGVDSAIRRVLMCLVNLADETGCAIVLIRHFNKDKSSSAKNRGGGSVAYAALVRSVIQASPLQEPDKESGATHGIACAINNLSAKPATIGYTFTKAPEIDGLPKDEDGIGIALIRWCDTLDVSADELAQGVQDSRKVATLKDAAVEAITEILRCGPVNAIDATKQAVLASGASKSTVGKAATFMQHTGKLRRRPFYKPTGGIDYWTWELIQDAKTLAENRVEAANDLIAETDRVERLSDD